MLRPAIQVTLACPCMSTGYVNIDWIPGEYRVLTIEEAARLLAEHRAHEDRGQEV